MDIIPKNKNPYPQGLELTGFQKLNGYKFKVIDQLLNNQEILKLLKYNGKNINPFDKPNININNEEVVGKYILPYFKNDLTVNETYSIIKVYFGIIRRMNDTYKNTELCIDVLVPEEEQLILQGTRVEEIMHRVYMILTDSIGLGLGRLDFIEAIPIENKFVGGYRMIYKILGFN